MSAVRWAWVMCGLVAAVVTQGQPDRPGLRAKEVFITRTVCDQTLDVGTPRANWKRVLFPPGMTCRGSFKCKLTFKLMESLPLASDICVDYSRMKIYGRKSVILVEDDSHDDSFKERLTETRYPLITQYMNSVACVNKQRNLELTFHAECGQDLDQQFVGWMYVYVQSTTTGSIYFLDGGGRHRHRMSARGQPRVSLRSHVWTDIARGDPRTSTMRLSVVDESGFDLQQSVCIEWNPYVMPRVPRGVRVRIFKAYFNQDSAKSTFVTLQDGDRVEAPTVTHDCYPIRHIYEIIFEVSRDTSVPVEPSWNETELLFDLIIGANNQGNLVYGHQRKKGVSESTPGGYDTDDSESFQDFFPGVILIVGFSAAGLAVLFIMYLCCQCWCAQKGQCHGAEPPVSANPEPSPAGADNTGRASEPASLPMVPRATPTAPAWNQDEDEPPSYTDLFPDKV